MTRGWGGTRRLIRLGWRVGSIGLGMWAGIRFRLWIQKGWQQRSQIQMELYREVLGHPTQEIVQVTIWGLSHPEVVGGPNASGCHLMEMEVLPEAPATGRQISRENLVGIALIVQASQLPLSKHTQVEVVPEEAGASAVEVSAEAGIH